MKTLKKNKTFFAQPIPKITPIAQVITPNNEAKCLERLQNQQKLDEQEFLFIQNTKEDSVVLTLFTNCIMGQHTNKERFQICFEYLSYEQLVNKQSHQGFIFFKNFEELEIFTTNEKVYKIWNEYFRLRLISHDFHESYDVKKMIGKGHFAKVYYAVNRETKKPFAIKAFSKEGLLSEKNGQESIINEMYIMRKLSHPHCLRLYEIYETEHSLYFVIELISGGELLKRICSQKKFHESDVKILLRNLLHALNHCHKNCIMHRDLKPENLLLRDNTNIHDIVIADFGLATQLIEGKEDEILFKRCGTPGYVNYLLTFQQFIQVAPEVLKWKDNSKTFYDFKCDIFSAGCIFHLLITGLKAFEGDEQQEVIRINRECSIDYSLCKNTSPEALDLLKKMLDPNPVTRITIDNALQHPFLYCEEENVDSSADEGPNLQNIIQTIALQDRKFLGSQQGSFADSYGSFHLNQKPLLNGEINTIEKVNENMQLNSEMQFKTKKPAPLIKQSSYGRNKLQVKEEESKGSDGLQSAGKKQVNEMHKKAIMNTMMKEQGENVATPQKQPQKLAATGKSSSFKVKKTNE